MAASPLCNGRVFTRNLEDLYRQIWKHWCAPESDAAPGRPIDLQPLYEQALAQHRAGDLTGAERLYQEILAADADHAGALHLLGVIALQTGRHDEAARLIERAIEKDGTVAVYHCNFG